MLNYFEFDHLFDIQQQTLILRLIESHPVDLPALINAFALNNLLRRNQ